MRTIITTFAVLLAFGLFTSCNDYETYADQKEKERDAVSDFISSKGINVISEEEFNAKGNVTDTARNEYVYMNNTGVYMQIRRKGNGSPIQNKENVDLYIRFLEQSIFSNNVITNINLPYNPDVMNISKSGSTFTASFTSGIMYSTYGASVPSGWLVPLNYVGVDISNAEGDIARVHLIVPHTQGHSVASANVYPYYYEITYQRPAGL
jgi:hypothetical protein